MALGSGWRMRGIMLAHGRILAAALALAAFFACVFAMWSNEKGARGLVEEGVFYVWPRLGGAEIGVEAADILRGQSDVVVATERTGLIMVSSDIG